ncbi:MAG TPA: hypothetical protein P5132_00430 [Bacteroidales bacterium]|nr:hypothetical protein [Bacteroidales bacterium]
MKRLKLFGIIKIIIPFLILAAINSCMHDEFEFDKLDDEMEFTAGILTPVAYGSLTFEDIISEFDSTSFLDYDADGLLYLTYRDSLFSFIAEDLLQVPNQDFIEYFLEPEFAIPAGPWPSVSIERTENFPFTFSQGEKPDSIKLDQGNIVFNVTSDFQHTGIVEMIFPNIRLYGDTLKHTIVIDDPSGSFSFNETIPIDNYTIILNDSSTNDTLYLPVNFHVELYNEGNPVNASDQIAVVATIEDLDFDGVFGYIGDYELMTETGQLDLGFFKNSLDGYIRFENPEINLYLNNSYGVPAEVNISRFTGFNAAGDSVVLDIDATANPFRYAYPKLSDYWANNLLKDTVLSITGENSNFPDFLAFMPSRLEYNMIANSNPDGEGADYNFVTDDGQIDVDFEFVLPLWFKADSFALVDTIELDLVDIEDDASFIEKVNIMLEVSNGLALDIDFQLYFLDSLYNPVDTLFAEGSQPIIPAGIINAENEVTSPGIKTSLITYTRDDIADLNTVRYGMIRAGLKTPTIENELQSVKFYNNYSVGFNLSVGIDVKANSNDF